MPGARFPNLSTALAGAHHVDVIAVHSTSTLREFIARMMSYEPGWVVFLYRVRKLFVTLLGMHQESVPRAPHWRSDQVPMQPGQPASFFTVRSSTEEDLCVVDAEARHLRATLCVVRELDQFSLVTIVHYRHWTGPIYFNVIRPFHHLVVRGMARAGASVLASSG